MLPQGPSKGDLMVHARRAAKNRGGGGGHGIQYLVSLQWPVVQLDFSDGMHMNEKGFIPKYLTFSKFGQIYQYTSCLLSKFRFHTNIPHFGGPVYQYTSCFLKIPAIYQYTACMIWARKKGIPIYLMFSKNGQIYQYTSI